MDTEQQIMSEVISAAVGTAPAEAPLEPDKEVTPAASEPVTEPEQSASAEEDFYKSQYENLQKDYTRKAQELAELKRINSEPQPEDSLPWEKDPNYQPKSWKEVYDLAKQATLREVSPLLSEVEQSMREKEALAQARQAAEAEMTAIKAKDPKIDETAIYTHANKFGFASLQHAYDNLMYIRSLEKDVQAKVLKNLKNRAEEPIGISGATPVTDEAPSYQEIVQSKSIRDAASAALARLQGK